MRVDKDALIKHHWWILLALFFLLWLVTVVMIKTASAASKAKADFDSAQSSLKATEAKVPKNQSFNKPWEEYGATYTAQKDRIWGDAWEVQKDIFDWPSSPTAKLDRLKYYDDPIGFFERQEYKEDLWKTQFKNLEGEMDPIDFSGGNEGFLHIMLPGFAKQTRRADAGQAGGPAPGIPGIGGPGIPRGGAAPAQQNVVVDNPTAFDTWWKFVPSEEECWLAQEDFWVKRELLRIVRDAVRSIARFTEDKDALKGQTPPEGVVSRHLFRNNLWEIDFMVEKPKGQWIISPKSTIKNLHPAARIVPLSASPTSGGLHFVLRQSNKIFPFKVDGEPLAYGAVAKFNKQTEVDSINFEKPFELEQAFENANSPVRQIVELQLGKQSSRTANLPLLASLLIKPKADETAPGSAPKPATAPPGVPAPPAPAPGAAAGSVADEVTQNGLTRMRYIFRSQQCRHMPVALLLIVDQAHMHEVLVAMSNSRLRVQTTQVQYRHINHYHPSSAGRLAPGSVAPQDEDPNLVEMAIYGIASLYERFPPKDYKPSAPPPAAPGAPTPGAPGTPAPGAAAPGTPTTGKPGVPTTAKPGAPTTAKPGTPGPAPAGVPPTTAPGKPAPAAGKPGEPPGGTPPGKAAPPKAADPAKPTEPGKADPSKAPANPPDKGKAPEPGKP